MKQTYTHRQTETNNTGRFCKQLIYEYDEHSREVIRCKIFAGMQSESPGYMFRCIKYDNKKY